MVHGPREFITPIQVKILEYRQAIQLNEDEGFTFFAKFI